MKNLRWNRETMEVILSGKFEESKVAVWAPKKLDGGRTGLPIPGRPFYLNWFFETLKYSNVQILLLILLNLEKKESNWNFVFDNNKKLLLHILHHIKIANSNYSNIW